MAVRCSKCGEELLGAVNRCWKCGQTFALHPEMDGTPPVRTDVGQKGSGVFIGPAHSMQENQFPTKTPDPLAPVTAAGSATQALSPAPGTPQRAFPTAPQPAPWTPQPLPPRRATTAE